MFFLDKKDDYPSPAETVKQVHLAGGVAFLAHVHEYKWVKDKIEYITQLIKDSNLDGIECYYNSFTEEQTKYLLELCDKKKLYKSGGSDYHGLNKNKIQLGVGYGDLKIPKNMIQEWI